MNNTGKYVIYYLTLRYWHEKHREEECHVFCNTKEHVCGQTIRNELCLTKQLGITSRIYYEEFKYKNKYLDQITLAKSDPVSVWTP